MADIELVIKMPKELYNYIMTEGYDEHLDRRFDYQIRLAVKDGTPLPKGYGDLIDVDELREDFKTSKKISFAERMDISCIVDHAPIIIEADKENRSGRYRVSNKDTRRNV